MQKERKAVQIKADMNIMTANTLPDIKSDKQGLGIAVDIGTTTVVMYLYDCGSSKLLGFVSRLNAQTSIGVDVISRIKYCSDYENGLKLLNSAIITEFNDLLGEVLKQCGADKKEIKHVTVTGNTTMLHLFAKISPVSMGVSPFTPASLFGQYHDASGLGVDLPGVKAYLVPCISAFVGGDITSAILASRFFESDDLCLLLDIGTNGEVALGSKHGIFVTSTAAGPAFEGAHISHGMAGVPGAINSVFADRGKIGVTTIGDKKAQGLCGSGLLDAIALILDTGLIDETGRILSSEKADDLKKAYITEYNGLPALKIHEDIVLTQKDIREVQTAKAAVAAGVLSLLHHAQKDISDVQKVYLAGGFGNFLDKRSAVRIGLLPKEAEGKIVPIGNAAGSGAIMTLLSDTFFNMNQQIADAGKHVELGSNPYFMDKYIDCMYFPTE